MAKAKPRSHRDLSKGKSRSKSQANPSRRQSSSQPQRLSRPIPVPSGSRINKPQPRTKPTLSKPKSHRRPTNPDSTSAPAPTPSTAPIGTARLPFPRDQPILLVGEGDFSFAKCLHATHHCTSLTATTLLTAEALAQTHAPSSPVHAVALMAAGHTVLYGVDAKTVGRPGVPHGAALRKRRFATVIFNFPHVGGRSTDVARQARANRELLEGFFEGAGRVLRDGDGRVVVTLWEGPSYKAWGLKGVAKERGYGVERSGTFDWGLWTGYQHVRNAGMEIISEDRNGWSGRRAARMWIFRRLADLQKENAQQANRRASSDEDESRPSDLDSTTKLSLKDTKDQRADSSDAWEGLSEDESLNRPAV